MDAQPGKAWTAIVLAGQRPEVDGFAFRFGQRFKALVPLRGEPMLSHVLRTLLATPEIANILVLAQEDLLVGPLSWAANRRRIRSVPSLSGIADSIAAAITTQALPWPVLVTTADHPLLTPAIVSTFTARGGGDLTIGVVERRVMLSAFPESRRTWLSFRGGAYTGANLFAFRSPRSLAALTFWAQAERDRKRPWRLLRRFGLLLSLRALTGTISLRDAVASAGRRLGLSACLVELDQAVAGIDVDNLDDHALADRILQGK